MKAAESRPVIRATTRMMTCTIIVALTTIVHFSLGCFPMQDVFQYSTRWMQTTSMNSRRMVEVGVETEDSMIIETIETTAAGDVIKQRTQLWCMMEYGEHRYLVRIEDEVEGSIFMCYQFNILTDHVIRQGRTEDNINRKRVNCIDDYYAEDEEVLVAYKDIQPQQCPLAGGYQLIIQQSMAMGQLCMKSVKIYNPFIQFHCDGRGSGNVLIDFGKTCLPLALNPYIGGRDLTHLRCVAHWEASDFHSVLLQMRDHPLRFWCLHYKVVNWDKSGGKSLDQAELVSIFLTVDGRCSSQNFGTEDVPRNTSMFGHLTLYKPFNDIKCTEAVYVESCKLDEDKCLETIECPKSCGRCLKKLDSNNCTFPADISGSWKVLNSDRYLEMLIDKTRIKSPNFGDFMCLGKSELRRYGYLYTVVQINAAATCPYYYSCAEMLSPNQGVLTFQLQPGFRTPDTGELIPCTESYPDQPIRIRPPKAEWGFTLINQHKLQKISCNFLERSAWTTKIPGCRIIVHECSGECHIFNVTFDTASCDNDTQQMYNIENRHICHARVNFYDDVYGIVSKAVTSGKFLCWIFGNNRLFVSTAEDCNRDSMDRIYRDGSADERYDPVIAISLTLPQENSAQTMVLHISSLFMFSLLVAYICGVVFLTSDCR